MGGVGRYRLTFCRSIICHSVEDKNPVEYLLDNLAYSDFKSFHTDFRSLATDLGSLKLRSVNIDFSIKR